jgi:hypothetical protein
MKTTTLAALLMSALLPSPSPAQVSLRVELGVPLPPAPSLVLIQPGVQVVAGYPEEVFFTGGYYWLRRDEAWYRSIHPRTGFVYLPPSRVPPGLVRLPPGHYRNYGKAQAKADRQAWKAQEKASHENTKRGHGH